MYSLIPFVRGRSLGRVHRDFDDLFSRFFAEMDLPKLREEHDFVPAVDFKETDEGYELSAEVPCLKPEEIEVSLHGDVLVLKGEKRDEREEDKDGYHLVERSYGKFYRSFRLPQEVDRDKLEARHAEGVLKVSLPKSGEVEPKEVEIKKG